MLRIQLSSNHSLSSSNEPTYIEQGDSTFEALLQKFISTGDLDAGQVSQLKAYFQPMVNPPLFQMNELTDGAVDDGNVVDGTSSLTKDTSWSPSTSLLQRKASVDAIVEQVSQKYGVDSSLIHAVIENESSYRTTAVSSAGAKGLMQLMDETGSSMGVTNPFDAEKNVDGGTRFLSYLLKKYDGNEAVALAAYNTGPGRVDRLGIHSNDELWANFSALPQETQNYVTKVLKSKTHFMI
jgi:hypothetical protein